MVYTSAGAAWAVARRNWSCSVDADAVGLGAGQGRLVVGDRALLAGETPTRAAWSATPQPSLACAQAPAAPSAHAARPVLLALAASVDVPPPKLPLSRLRLRQPRTALSMALANGLGRLRDLSRPAPRARWRRCREHWCLRLPPSQVWSPAVLSAVKLEPEVAGLALLLEQELRGDLGRAFLRSDASSACTANDWPMTLAKSSVPLSWIRPAIGRVVGDPLAEPLDRSTPPNFAGPAPRPARTPRPWPSGRRRRRCSEVGAGGVAVDVLGDGLADRLDVGVLRPPDLVREPGRRRW